MHLKADAAGHSQPRLRHSKRSMRGVSLAPQVRAPALARSFDAGRVIHDLEGKKFRAYRRIAENVPREQRQYSLDHAQMIFRIQEHLAQGRRVNSVNKPRERRKPTFDRAFEMTHASAPPFAQR